MTSREGTDFRITGPLWRNPPVTVNFPFKETVMQSFDVYLLLSWSAVEQTVEFPDDLRHHDTHLP